MPKKDDQNYKLGAMEEAIDTLQENQKDNKILYLNAFQRMHDSQTEMLVEMRGMRADLASHLKNDEGIHDALHDRIGTIDNAKDGRVTVLERDKIKVMGAAAGIAALLTGGINGIMKMFGGNS